MNPTIKRLWLEALESGEYKQTTSVLNNGEGGYCCLGVLCDVYRKEVDNCSWSDEGTFLVSSKDGVMEMKESYPPEQVYAWAGIDNYVARGYDVPFGELDDNGCRDSLVDINDRSDNFDEIIAAIKEYL